MVTISAFGSLKEDIKYLTPNFFELAGNGFLMIFRFRGVCPISLQRTLSASDGYEGHPRPVGKIR
jgi:hypothetical protein